MLVPYVSRMTHFANIYTNFIPNATLGSHVPIIENGLPSNAAAEATGHAQFGHRTPTVNAPQQSSTIRHASSGSNYQGQSGNLIAQNNANNSNLIRNASVDMMRSIQR